MLLPRFLCMEKRTLPIVLPVVLVLGLISVAATVDLNDLFNYAGQPIPAYITRDNTPPDNPITDAGATLGRVLFYDKNLSSNNTVSCGTCHQQAFAFSDPLIASVGVNGTTGRHSMRLVNTRFSDEVQYFWDERAASLEEQTTQPIQDHAEMGFSGTMGDPDLDSLLRKLEAVEYYPALFEFAFGDPAITEERMQDAMAQFIRSIQSFDSRFDQGRALAPNDGAPFPTFTPDENAGKNLFLAPPVFAPGANRIGGGLGCNPCHLAPEFSIDPGSLHNGVTTSIGGGTDFTNTKSPTLRDLVDPTGALNGPMMHDGSMSTLDQMIDHYNNIPALTPGLDPRLAPGGIPQNLNITFAERAQLKAFLMTLTGSNVYTDERWSDPFIGDSLDIEFLRCAIPEGLLATGITSTQADLSWLEVDNAIAYRVTGTNGTTGATGRKILSGGSSTSFRVRNLDPLTTYTWTVEAACDLDDISDPSVSSSFTTAGPRLEAIEMEISMFPNPAIDRVSITGLDPDAEVSYQLIDASGKAVLTSSDVTGSQGSLDVALNNIPSGIYQMTVRYAEVVASSNLVVLQ